MDVIIFKELIISSFGGNLPIGSKVRLNVYLIIVILFLLCRFLLNNCLSIQVPDICIRVIRSVWRMRSFQKFINPININSKK